MLQQLGVDYSAGPNNVLQLCRELLALPALLRMLILQIVVLLLQLRVLLLACAELLLERDHLLAGDGLLGGAVAPAEQKAVVEVLGGAVADCKLFHLCPLPHYLLLLLGVECRYGQQLVLQLAVGCRQLLELLLHCQIVALRLLQLGLQFFVECVKSSYLAIELGHHL